MHAQQVGIRNNLTSRVENSVFATLSFAEGCVQERAKTGVEDSSQVRGQTSESSSQR